MIGARPRGQRFQRFRKTFSHLSISVHILASTSEFMDFRKIKIYFQRMAESSNKPFFRRRPWRRSFSRRLSAQRSQAGLVNAA
jgi:hypothetical protein